ncbi:MAG: hypothetical protein M1834_009259 [Cirrosporium novae-zelandiae]|nr:MAG: hypothetical protein M1834_009259 [Cirrosporium novae-zelandiae]
MSSNGPNKRKATPATGFTSQNRKRAKTQDARTVAVQTSDQALKNGELDVSAFIKAREYEIRALESGMAKSKKGLTTRAFQNVPRDLRRRTASHNVKRVPKRLRARAAREMREDNTPTVTARRRKKTPHQRLRLETAKRLQAIGKLKKNKLTGLTSNPPSRPPKIKKNNLNQPPKPESKFRKRQLHKTWLPTHIFHTKRAHITEPKEPLWRFAIPLSPTAKSYRPTHRASTQRGAIAWDMSYISTIGLEGRELGLQSLLKGLSLGNNPGTEGIWGKSGTKWREGKRSWSGWLYERDGEKNAITPTTIIWRAEYGAVDVDMESSAKSNDKRRIMVRVHPSGFLHLWNELLKVAKMQHPPVAVEDLRFEIGSIDVMGPGSTEALIGALKPILGTEEQGHEAIWLKLKSLTDPGALPPKALLTFNVSDPRLHHPPKSIFNGSSSPQTELTSILATWPADSSRPSTSFFDRKLRLAAAHALPSQKAINRRRSQLSAGTYPDPLPPDPQIPIILLASRCENGSAQGTWTVMLPWKCVLPVWSSLMYYPLSSGGNPCFGGLKEVRQTAFENSVPWFPGDYPGTNAGWKWELAEREKRYKEWKSRPKGKRIEWESLSITKGTKGEVGKGWACDWERLVQGPPTNVTIEKEDGTLVEQSTQLPTEKRGEEEHDNFPGDGIPCKIHQLSSLLAKEILSFPQDSIPSQYTSFLRDGSLVTVKITLISRGTPVACGRIYRLPAAPADLHSKWLALVSKPKKTKRKEIPLPKDANRYERRQKLAASLLAPPEGENTHLPVPNEDDLIGFVTTGNFNLGEGRGTGIGNVLMRKIMECKGEGKRLCIIREAGQSIGRLGRWEVV